MGGYSEFPPRKAPCGPSLSPLLVCNLPTEPQSYIVRPGPSYSNPWVFSTYRHCHVKIRPLPDRRDFDRDNPHPRSGCCRESKLGSSRSVPQRFPEPESRFYRIPVLTRCPDGHGPSHPCPLHPVSICYRAQPFRFIGRFGTRFFNANPKSSKWFNRDRFVLSNGYALVSHSVRMI